jgi:uncharacterized protein
LEAWPSLRGQQYLNLTTFRKNGQPVTTPVWFAQEGDTLYVFTLAESGKVKRIRNNGQVEVGPCDRSGKPLGPVAPAHATIVDGEQARHADAVLNQKYGLLKRAFDLLARLRGGRDARAFLAITPPKAM